MFAERPYEHVQMDEIAERAEISRALLYRYFPSKATLFAEIYRRAATDLVDEVRLDADKPLPEQVTAALDMHLDYFQANRNTVLAANRTLAGDPGIQAIIAADHVGLQQRMLDATGLTGAQRNVAAAVLLGWLRFVHSLCLDWLEAGVPTRQQLRAACLGALLGALSSLDVAEDIRTLG